MAQAVISYDKDLPEIPDRRAWEKPTAYLRKKEGSKDEFEIEPGRRPSKLLLVNKLRQAVDDWRSGGYQGSSSVTERLFTYWFEEDHLVDGQSFRYHFGQREAVETLICLVEVRKIRDSKVLVDSFGEIFYPEGTQQMLPGSGIAHQTAVDGRRQIRRYIPEVEGETIQDLPAENLRRHAFKMATGSGKTIVMAMLMVWCYFHKRMIQDSDLSTNFLLLAPNVIVYQRLEKDFASNQIFHQLPLIPLEWKGQWNLKVILRGESTEPDPSGTPLLHLGEADAQMLLSWTGEISIPKAVDREMTQQNPPPHPGHYRHLYHPHSKPKSHPRLYGPSSIWPCGLLLRGGLHLKRTCLTIRNISLARADTQAETPSDR